MKVHSLKVHPEPFGGLWVQTKPYELRENDRDFQPGDILLLREWDPKTGLYSGGFVLSRISHMTRGGEWGLPATLCVLGLKFLDKGNGWLRDE